MVSVIFRSVEGTRTKGSTTQGTSFAASLLGSGCSEMSFDLDLS